MAHAPAACSFPGENARSWEAPGEARPGQSSLSVKIELPNDLAIPLLNTYPENMV